MASSQTTHFGLNQWAANDYVIREEFNEDNRIIDTELNKITRSAVGSYTGTGAYGSSNPNSLSFPFAPKLVIIQSAADSKYGPLFIRAGVSTTYCKQDSSGSATTVNWSNGGKTLSWYTTSSQVAYQLNSNGHNYNYIALG